MPTGFQQFDPFYAAREARIKAHAARVSSDFGRSAPRPDYYKKHYARRKYGGPPRRAVLCIETGQRFSSPYDAFQWAGAGSRTSITVSCETGNAAKGLHFCYVGDPTYQQRPTKTRPVVCVNTGETFQSLADAMRSACDEPFSSARAYRTAHMVFSRRVAQGWFWRGRRWRYAEGDRMLSTKRLNPTLRALSANANVRESRPNTAERPGRAA